MVIEAWNERETREIGRKLGEQACSGQVYALIGDLGTGKTVFSQGFAEGLGITESVNSPTFTIVQIYEEGRLCWPVISWSSIDYCGRWKALHYAEKRFFAPLMISCQEEGMMTQEADMNREHFVFEKSIRLNVANETRKEQCVQVSWAVRNAKAEVLHDGGVKELTVPALSSVWLDKVLLSDIDIFSEYVSYELRQEGKIISEGTVIFSYPKYFRYEDPHLSYRAEGDEIVVSADAYAKSVEIQNEDQDFILSDNYFDINGDEKRIKIFSGEVKGIRLKSVYDIR